MNDLSQIEWSGAVGSGTALKSLVGRSKTTRNFARQTNANFIDKARLLFMRSERSSRGLDLCKT